MSIFCLPVCFCENLTHYTHFLKKIKFFWVSLSWFLRFLILSLTIILRRFLNITKWKHLYSFYITIHYIIRKIWASVMPRLFLIFQNLSLMILIKKSYTKMLVQSDIARMEKIYVGLYIMVELKEIFHLLNFYKCLKKHKA